MDVPQDSRSEFTQFAARLTEADLIRLLQYCAAAEVDMRRNFNPRIRLQLLLLKFASFDQSVVLGDLIRRLESKTISSEPPTASAKPQKSSTSSLPGSRKSQNVEPLPATAPATAPSASSPNTASDAELLSRVQSAWSEICAAVSKEHNSRARMLQLGGYPTAFRNRVLTVNFAKSFDLDAVRGCIPSLQKELVPLVGEVQVGLALGPIPQSSSDEESENDPVLNLLKERLDAKPIN